VSGEKLRKKVRNLRRSPKRDIRDQAKGVGQIDPRHHQRREGRRAVREMQPLRGIKGKGEVTWNERGKGNLRGAMPFG